MPNADTTLIDLAEDAGLSLATYTERARICSVVCATQAE